MPLVRIDLRKGKDPAYRQQIGRVVFEAICAKAAKSSGTDIAPGSA
jgi:hypothetical protein